MKTVTRTIGERTALSLTTGAATVLRQSGRAALVLLVMMLTAATAWAQTNYTVTLKAGDGTGSDITISSADEANMATSFHTATNGQFWREDGNLWFMLPDCPASFTAPSGKMFKNWYYSGNDESYGPGSSFPLSGNLTLTAQWKDGGSASSLSFSIPPTIRIPYGTTQTVFDIQFASATFYDPENGEIYFDLYDGSFTCSEHNGTIPFTMDTNGINAWRGLNSLGDFAEFNLYSSTTMPYTCQGFINISADAWAAAKPGVYTASLKWRWDSWNDDHTKDDGTVTLTLTVPDAAVSLADNADNTSAISDNDGKTCVVTLDGRTLYTDGDWNTLCLPFDVADFTDTPLEGFTVMELDTDVGSYAHATGFEGGTLYLNFKNATSIDAGKPYIVKKAMGASTVGRTATSGTAGYNSSEGYASLVDGNTGTKWCSNTTHSGGSPWVCQFTTASPVSVTGYTLTTGNDTGDDPDRNPRVWTLEAKQNEGDSWTVIDSRDVTTNGGDALPEENTTESQVYAIAAEKQGIYQYFRFMVNQSGGDLMQLAELTLHGNAIGITNPTFEGVTIDASTPTAVSSTDGKVSFTGTYSPVTISGENRSILFLGSANTLYYPNAAMSIKSCRAYFQLNGIEAGGQANAVRAFVLNFGEDEATGIREITNPTPNPSPAWEGSGCAWYSLDGRRLSGKPSKSGVYINAGKKIVIK